jgi:hypothetical protein
MSGPHVSPEWTPNSRLATAVSAAGFLYDPGQDIIYSKLDAWQQYVGFCELYDDLAPVSISSVIDAEPIYFTYEGKEWMIELWKGQYGIETGAEIGVYNRPARSSVVSTVADTLARLFPAVGQAAKDIAHEFKLYGCATDEPLEIAFTLTRKATGETILSREGRHWWLTAFKWGVYSEPEELLVDAQITLLGPAMRDAFVAALEEARYAGIQTPDASSVRFTFDRPKHKQSSVRESLREKVQGNNRRLVDAYNDAKKSLGVTTNDPNVIQQKLGDTQVFKDLRGFIDLIIASKEKLESVIAKR